MKELRFKWPEAMNNVTTDFKKVIESFTDEELQLAKELVVIEFILRGRSSEEIKDNKYEVY